MTLPVEIVTSTPDAATAVIVRLAAARYGLPMTVVAEVGRIPRVTRIPGVPDWVTGIANWRGRILPVVDLRSLLGGGAGGVGRDGRIVVLGDEAMTLGLLVEGVEGVAAVPARELDPPPGTIGTEAADLLVGQWSDEHGPIGMLDFSALLRLRHRLPSPRRGD